MQTNFAIEQKKQIQNILYFSEVIQFSKGYTFLMRHPVYTY